LTECACGRSRVTPARRSALRHPSGVSHHKQQPAPRPEQEWFQPGQEQERQLTRRSGERSWHLDERQEGFPLRLYPDGGSRNRRCCLVPCLRCGLPCWRVGLARSKSGFSHNGASCWLVSPPSMTSTCPVT